MRAKDFFEFYAKKTEASNVSKAEDTCRSVIGALQECLDNMTAGERLSFYGFGTFVKKSVSPRKYYNFQTKKMEESQAFDVIKFIQSRAGN